MKLPRDISGLDLAKMLQTLGYEVTRQTGSHIRLRSTQTGAEHFVTVPSHSPLKVGTLNSILSEIAAFRGWTKNEVLNKITR